MRALVRTDGVTKAYGPQLVLDNAALQVLPGEKVALVGPNGSGKSTLFKLIAGELSPDLGTIEVPDDLRLGYMPQLATVPPATPVREVLSAPTPEVRRLARELAAIESRMGDPAFWEAPESSDVTTRYGDLQAQLATARAGAQPLTSPVLSDLGVAEEDFDKRFGDLSGGEKTKVLLARALAQHEQMDLLLLDEPTNHLDMETIEWVEELLVTTEAAVMLAAHDRYLLDNVATKVLEVDRRKVLEWTGNYTDYREQREALSRAWDAKRRKDRSEVERQLAIIEEIKRRNRYDAQAQSKARRLEKIRRGMSLDDEGPSAHKAFRLEFKAVSKRSIDVLAFDEVGKWFPGRTLFRGATFEILRGDKVALVGPNGSGKTTLLRMVVGEEKPSEGTIVLAPSAKVAYYDQEHEGLDPDRTLLEEVKTAKDKMGEAEARGLLGRFGFKGDDAFKKVASLSGGERARMALLKFIVSENNLLVLDEPTNHLDIESQEIVQQAIQEYPGTVLVVSHNRSFLDAVCNKVLLVAHHRVGLFSGNFSQTRTLQRMSEFAQAGKPRVYKVRKAFKDWERGARYSAGDTIRVTGGETQSFRRLLRWAEETGRVEEAA